MKPKGQILREEWHPWPPVHHPQLRPLPPRRLGVAVCRPTYAVCLLFWFTCHRICSYGLEPRAPWAPSVSHAAWTGGLVCFPHVAPPVLPSHHSNDTLFPTSPDLPEGPDGPTADGASGLMPSTSLVTCDSTVHAWPLAPRPWASFTWLPAPTLSPWHWSLLGSLLEFRLLKFPGPLTGSSWTCTTPSASGPRLIALHAP